VDAVWIRHGVGEQSLVTLRDGIVSSICEYSVKGGALLASDCAANNISAFP
jgi:hypothetical protein